MGAMFCQKKKNYQIIDFLGMERKRKENTSQWSPRKPWRYDSSFFDMIFTSTTSNLGALFAFISMAEDALLFLFSLTFSYHFSFSPIMLANTLHGNSTKIWNIVYMSREIVTWEIVAG